MAVMMNMREPVKEVSREPHQIDEQSVVRIAWTQLDRLAHFAQGRDACIQQVMSPTRCELTMVEVPLYQL